VANNLDMKRGDTAPNLVLNLTDGSTPVDLSAAAEIRVVIRFGAKLISRSVDGSSNGQIVMRWQDGDLDQSGVYTGEVEVTWSDGTIQTWPAQGNFFVTVRDDIR
jgi:hypothetical protein